MKILIHPESGEWDSEENWREYSYDGSLEGGISIDEQIEMLIEYDPDLHVLNDDGTTILKESCEASR